VRNFLLFRRQVHEGPLYTQRSNAARDPTRPRRIYDQAQRNSQYVYRGSANADLFNGVETFSTRFRPKERTLPDFSTRPYVKRLFPPELQPTLEEGEAGRGKRLKLSSVTAMPTAEDVMNMNGGVLDEEALKKLAMVTEGGQDDVAVEDDEVAEEDEDYAYDDEDAGDYDAEAYFDDGDDEVDDADDGGGDDGGYF
jgi:DNA-directed RNA polymerase III subunit RPC7